MDKNKLKQLADYAIREGTEFSEHGYWSVSYEELLYHFGAEVSNTNELGKALEKELKQREEINELIMTEDAIEMTYHMEYCENCEGDPLSLLSVLGCNIYDEHYGSDEKMADNKPIIMNAVMERKASEYDYTRCVVDKIVEVSKFAFESFLRAPLNDYDFIEDFNQEEHDYRSNTRPCLLLLGDGHDDGILINSEGSPYARYSSYIPHARQIVEAHEIEQQQAAEPEEDESPVLSM